MKRALTITLLGLLTFTMAFAVVDCVTPMSQTTEDVDGEYAGPFRKFFDKNRKKKFFRKKRDVIVDYVEQR